MLQGVGRYDRDAVGNILHRSAVEALALWMGEHAEWDYMQQPLNPIIRIYWAIVTNRTGLAKFLWSQSDFPFISAFVGAYVYKHLGLRLGQVSGPDQRDGTQVDCDGTTKEMARR